MGRHDRTVIAIVSAAMAACVALTGTAFWLSYQHLQMVAASHGLQTAEIRSWAWPAIVDLFILIGEMLVLLDSVERRSSAWSVGLLVFGGASSIALNISGVGMHRPVLDYVVAAFPPVSAMLAFGAIMVAVRRHLAKRTQPGDQPPATDSVYIEQPRASVEQPATMADQPSEQPDQPADNPPTHDEDREEVTLLTTREVMLMLGISRSTIGRHTQNGTLPVAATDRNGGNLFHPADVDKLRRAS